MSGTLYSERKKHDLYNLLSDFSIQLVYVLIRYSYIVRYCILNVVLLETKHIWYGHVR